MPDSTVLTMDNPLITQAQGMTVWSLLRNIPAYYPSTVKWRGNPAVQPGDILDFESEAGATSKHIVTSQTLHISGFFADSESPGEAKSLNDMDVDTALDRRLNQYTDEITEEVGRASQELQSQVDLLASRISSMQRQMVTLVAAAVNLQQRMAELGTAVDTNTTAISALQTQVSKQPLSGIYNATVALTGTPVMATLVSGNDSITIPADGNGYTIAGCTAMLDGTQLDISASGTLPDIRYTVFFQ